MPTAPGASTTAQPATTAVPPAIEVVDVVRTFGDVRALDGLSLRVERGETFGLLGPNGAGKSTLTRLLTGTMHPTSGEVRVLGLPLPARSREVRFRTGLVPQVDTLDDELTCAENLAVFARLYGLRRAMVGPAVERGLAIARLADRADTFVDDLSGGMRRRLLIARALLHRPEVVLLDEPTVGLDPQIRQELWQLVDEVRASGTTTVLTTHYIEEAERLCQRVAIVDHGRLLALDSPRRLIEQHVRGDVVVEVVADAPVRARIAAAAARIGLAHRSAGTSIAVFTHDVEVLAPHVEDGDLRHRVRRPANLEDVFVTLTGQELG